jgi:hypothetical protein
MVRLLLALVVVLVVGPGEVLGQYPGPCPGGICYGPAGQQGYQPAPFGFNGSPYGSPYGGCYGGSFQANFYSSPQSFQPYGLYQPAPGWTTYPQYGPGGFNVNVYNPYERRPRPFELGIFAGPR